MNIILKIEDAAWSVVLFFVAVAVAASQLEYSLVSSHTGLSLRALLVCTRPESPTTDPRALSHHATKLPFAAKNGERRSKVPLVRRLERHSRPEQTPSLSGG